ncbi:MAG: aminoglycoside phosphotransferase family protein [Pseudomonadota bacterium]
MVRQLIAEQFPAWAELPVLPVPTSGWDNRTFRLGDSMLVRLPSGEAYADAVGREQLWLPRLAPLLPLPIPEPLAEGAPGAGYPWCWSVYRWLDGEVASRQDVADLSRFAINLADFLLALQRIPATDGPGGRFRGGSLDRCQPQVAAAMEALTRTGDVDGEVVRAIWAAAVAAPLEAEPVWFHGDVAAGNLLTRNGVLSAVIDFGGLAVGDPACDMTIAWTFLDAASRDAFRARLGVSEALWNRGRGWALWKALIVEAGMIETNVIETASSRYALDQLIDDHRARAA